MSVLFWKTRASAVGFGSAVDSLEIAISASKGQRTMSDEDVKVALVDTVIALKHQIKINESLIERVSELEEKKFTLKDLLHK